MATLGLLTMLVASAPGLADEQTLCVLDFNRLGKDGGVDWLQGGLADMMIRTLNRLGPYHVIERKHLMEILGEQGRRGSGLLDQETAVRRARLAKAQLLMMGSFVRQGDQLTIQIRLLRLSDQRILTNARWEDHYGRVLEAPRQLSRRLLTDLGRPMDPDQLQGIEREIPRTIDVAQAYYQGVQSFDAGQYPEALAHYLDAAHDAGDFTRAYPAVLEMYYLLGRSEHAVLFARRLASALEQRGDLSSALEYYFLAAQHCEDPLGNDGLAARLLERLLHLVASHERENRVIERTKRFILDKAEELQKTGRYSSFGKILADRSIRYLVWTGEMERGLVRRSEEEARGGFSALQDGQWIKKPVPKPSVLMWRIRALLTLGRVHARRGEIGPALDRYLELLDEYRFLTGHPSYQGRLDDSLKTEAHFMLLSHYVKTGQLVRNHRFNRINKLNLVEDGRRFIRDFGDSNPDPRARVASRYENRGHEYFDFAVPPGHQIDSVTLRAKVAGIAAFSVNLPKPVGWPPQFSFSKRLEKFKFSRPGHYQKTVALPAATEFVSIGTSWGPGLYSNTLEEIRYQQKFGLQGAGDIEQWEIAFSVSLKQPLVTRDRVLPERQLSPAIQKLIERYGAGWDQAFLVRKTQALAGGQEASLGQEVDDWTGVLDEQRHPDFSSQQP